MEPDFAHFLNPDCAKFTKLPLHRETMTW
jgi:hypothetical protein